LTRVLDHIEITRRWAEEFVVGLDLCPFAKKPLKEDRIDWMVVNDVQLLDKIIDGFIASEYTSTFVILPFLDEFESFLDVLAFCEHLNEVLGYSEDIKFVSFHPKNQYEGTKIDNEINYANRAPFATIQLLRSQDLDELKMTAEWKQEILDKNEATMKEQGSEKLRKIFDEYRK